MKKVKYLGFLLLFIVLTSCSSRYNAGTYEDVGKGRKGNIRVSVVVNSEGEISKIEVLDHSENNRMMKQVIDTMTPQMIEKNSSEVDGVTGATKSSNGYKEAVKKALKQAK